MHIPLRPADVEDLTMLVLWYSDNIQNTEDEQIHFHPEILHSPDPVRLRPRSIAYSIYIVVRRKDGV